MADLPPLNALRTFLFAAETGSFKLASERLFVTQAAVSHQIRLLEDTLGTQLFIRLNREVKLTDEGEQLLPYVRSAFNALKTGVDQLRADASPNHITLSVLPSFASSWLVPKLKSFQTLHPEFHVTIKPTLELENFEDSDVDLAIRFGKGDGGKFKSEFLMRDTLLTVASPELIGDEPMTNERLKQFPILEDYSPGSRGWIHCCAEMQLNPEDYHIALTIEDASMVIDAALAGQGIAFVRKSLAQRLIDEGRLVKVFDYELQSPYCYSLVGPENNFKKDKVRVFRDWIKKELEASFMPELFAYYGS